MKILIAIPTFENIMPEVFKAVYGMRTEPYWAMFDYVKGYDCAKARNMIAQEALDGGFDYVLMCDSDTLMPNDTLERFLEYPTDIVLGLCPHKNTDIGRCEIYRFGSEGFQEFYTYKSIPEEPRILVKGGGLACALIKTEVFRKMQYPYFKYVLYDNGEELSEDLYFCTKVTEAGFNIFADTRVRCGHAMRKFQYE